MLASDTFPLLKLPYSLLEAAKSEPSPNWRPIQPKATAELKIIPPVAPVKPNSNSSTVYIIFFALCVVGASLLIGAINNRQSMGIGILGFALLTIAILVIRNMVRSDDFINSEHQKRMSAYYSDLQEHHSKSRQAKRDYEDNLKCYQVKNEVYERELRLWKEERDLLLQPENVVLHRKSKMASYWAAVPKPKLNQAKASVKRGASEECFAIALYLVLWEQDIFLNQIVSFYDGEGGYCPDIVIWDKQSGILIDVEIDEPYVRDTNEPIHYCHSDDQKRDEAFSTHGWIVVRFTEEQVVKETAACAIALARLIAAIKSEQVFSLGENDFRQCLCGISNRPIWSKDGARELALIKFRETYLSGPLAQDRLYQTAQDKLLTNSPDCLMTVRHIAQTKRRRFTLSPEQCVLAAIEA